MKKLLILMLILGLTNVASATPAMSGDTTVGTGGGTITITISGTAAEASDDWIGGDRGGYQGYVGIDWVSNYYYADASGTTVHTNSASAGLGNEGGSGSATIGTYYDAVVFTAAMTAGDWTEGGDVDTGAWYTFDVVIPGGYYSVSDEIDVDLANEFMVVAGTHTITVVPEPVTIALLGLGGLFLRRRK